MCRISRYEHFNAVSARIFSGVHPRGGVSLAFQGGAPNRPGELAVPPMLHVRKGYGCFPHHHGPFRPGA